MQIKPCCEKSVKEGIADYQDWAEGYICPKCGTTIPLMQYYKLKAMIDAKQNKR